MKNSIGFGAVSQLRRSSFGHHRRDALQVFNRCFQIPSGNLRETGACGLIDPRTIRIRAFGIRAHLLKWTLPSLRIGSTWGRGRDPDPQMISLQIVDHRLPLIDTCIIINVYYEYIYIYMYTIIAHVRSTGLELVNPGHWTAALKWHWEHCRFCVD